MKGKWGTKLNLGFWVLVGAFVAYLIVQFLVRPCS